jgi:hypothetical protein
MATLINTFKQFLSKVWIGMIYLIIILLVALSLASCTSNTYAQSSTHAGSQTCAFEKNQEPRGFNH